MTEFWSMMIAQPYWIPVLIVLLVILRWVLKDGLFWPLLVFGLGTSLLPESGPLSWLLLPLAILVLIWATINITRNRDLDDPPS